MRPVEITSGYLQTAEGSALIAVGDGGVLDAAASYYEAHAARGDQGEAFGAHA